MPFAEPQAIVTGRELKHAFYRYAAESDSWVLVNTLVQLAKLDTVSGTLMLDSPRWHVEQAFGKGAFHRAKSPIEGLPVAQLVYQLVLCTGGTWRAYDELDAEALWPQRAEVADVQ